MTAEASRSARPGWTPSPSVELYDEPDPRRDLGGGRLGPDDPVEVIDPAENVEVFEPRRDRDLHTQRSKHKKDVNKTRTI